ncbi:SPOR domain-containing protein [Parvularcula sp. IMCC14364]|uniref:SPOR domain-containing protein n=1 Tax=Parvularcula sp. IMCC14364 TaxID=3067902 RepID=UPI0027418324|nr:SPOR domain-containing protein [Parvularcula sp. IMCC14364]
MTAADEYDEDYDDYYDDDEEGVSGFVVLVVGVVVLVVFSAVVWFAYQRGIQEGGTPLIAADPNPIKTEREIQFAETSPVEQEVFDTLEGNVPTEVIVDASDDQDPLEGFSETSSAVNSTPPPVTYPVEAQTPAPSTIEDVAVAAINQVEDVIEEPVQQVPATQAQPVQTTPVAASAAAGALAGTHVVQVGAFRSNAEAQGYFSTMQSRFGALLNGISADVQYADLGSRGVYHRLRVGPFSSKSDADSYCARLKQVGQDCLVKPV